jgi:integrase
MPQAKFVLKEPKANSKTLLYLFYNFNQGRLKFSTGQSIDPKFWNPAKQRAKETSSFREHTEFNQYLNKLEFAVNNAYRRLLNDGNQVTPELLKQELSKELGNKAPEKKLDLLEWMESEIENLKKDRKPSSIQVYKSLLMHLIEFSKVRRYKVSFETINIAFYEQFKDYLLKDRKMLTNTFGKQIKTLKSFLNLAVDKGITNNLAYKNRLFKVTQDTIDHIYLTSEELDIIYSLDLSSKLYLDRVRDLFLIGSHTGLRFSDFTKLDKENIKLGSNGDVLIVKTSKTGERVVIPLKPVVKSIWEKHNGLLPRAISNQKMNVYLKELGEIAGITYEVIVKKTSGKEIIETKCPKFQLISTHTARRSFATNAYLSGVPSISIMKLTGHRTESSFMKYIKVSQERNAELLKEHPFFN